MRGIVVYESMFGNTHLVADAIGDGLRASRRFEEVHVVPVHDAARAMAHIVDLLVVGGPTHVRGMSRASTREDAIRQAEESRTPLDPDAEGDGLREWFDSLDRLDVPAAAFDTRVDLPVALTGRASKGIARRLRRLHCVQVAEPRSFLVTADTELEPEELDHARTWGIELADALGALATPGGIRVGSR